MTEKIMVTGVNGFVGEHVVDAFKADGFEVDGVAFRGQRRVDMTGSAGVSLETVKNSREQRRRLLVRFQSAAAQLLA